MSTKDFPSVHHAFLKYVEQRSIRPANPTQLIIFSKQKNIPGLNWSKCSKYFKILQEQSTAIHKAEPPKNSIKNKKYSNETKRHHHKTTSGPIFMKPIKDNVVKINNNHKISTNNMQTAAINATPSSKHSHKRTHSAVDAETHKQNAAKNENKSAPFKTVMIDTLFSELNEDGNEEKQEKQINAETQTNNIKKNQLRLSKTPTTSFKSINIEQKLKPLSSIKETVSNCTIHKTVQKSKKRHPLLQKIWNKNKSSIWPKNRMPMSYDLKKWLIQNKFDRFSGKLYVNGIESMDDLRLLRTEDIMEDLCGKNNIGMTIIYRRKFIKKVLQFNNIRKDSFFGSLYDAMDKTKENEKNKKQFKYEMEAVDALTERIKETTKTIKMTKKLQYDIGMNTKNIKDDISKDFDALIKELALRKKEILQTIDRKNKIVMDRLGEQNRNICQTAKTLIITQQGTHKQMIENDASEQRTNEVIDLIESTFEECDKYTPIQYDYVLKASFKYNAGNSAQIKNYAKLFFNDEQLV